MERQRDRRQAFLRGPLRKQSKVFQKPEGTTMNRLRIQQDPPGGIPSWLDPNSRGELEVNGTYQNCFPVLIQFCLRGKGESFVKEDKIWRLYVFSYRSYLTFNKILLDMPRYRTIT